MRKIIFIWAAIYAVALLPSELNAETLSGHIVGIADGDTVTLLDSTNHQYKIRLSGIDAPEKSQPYGQVSKQSLSALIYDKDVNVDYSKYDRYGRLIGKVLLNNADINLEQIKRGLAWHYKKYQNEQVKSDQKIYAEEEVEARDSKIGLWQEPNPIAPWDWRRQR